MNESIIIIFLLFVLSSCIPAPAPMPAPRPESTYKVTPSKHYHKEPTKKEKVETDIKTKTQDTETQISPAPQVKVQESLSQKVPCITKSKDNPDYDFRDLLKTGAVIVSRDPNCVSK